MAIDRELRDFYRSHRYEAHVDMFEHRHEYPMAPYHRFLVDDFWSEDWARIELGFRESGKTTLLEEDVVMAAVDGLFRNCLIIGAKEELAAELLVNIKSELENNDRLRILWGENQRGVTWTGTKITLPKGHCIQARGVGQSIRGTQHRNWRPDLIIVNDFEDDDAVLSPEGRRQAMRWFLRTLLPACDRRRRKVRIYDTVRDADSVPMMLIKRQKWPHRIIPISYLDKSGQMRSSWPEHPTLTPEWIEAERQIYATMGELDIWEREYMCNPEPHADRTFSPDMIRVEPIVHTFQAKYAMIDPARSVRRTSATTGWAVWSWERHKLIVWEAGAKHMMPDEIIDLAFRLNAEHGPVEIGIEEDGLNEWLLQPLRIRISQSGTSLPYRGVRAPRGKLDFIRGLQPFFASGSVVFDHDMPEVREQLLSFPRGAIDAPNALAYALPLRPGRLIYDGWNALRHIEPAAISSAGNGSSVYVAANATRTCSTGVLVQLQDGRINILADAVYEGDSGESAEPLVRTLALAAGRGFTVIAGPRHFDQWQNVGLVQAFRALGVECRPGGAIDGGREFIRRELERLAGPAGGAFAVSPDAGWTLRAFAGGYSRDLHRGELSDEAQDNRYRTLMEGLESLCGLLAFRRDDDQQNMSFDRAGRPYLSIIPQRERANA